MPHRGNRRRAECRLPAQHLWPNACCSINVAPILSVLGVAAFQFSVAHCSPIEDPCAYELRGFLRFQPGRVLKEPSVELIDGHGQWHASAGGLSGGSVREAGSRRGACCGAASPPGFNGGWG
jgi:hypothetical protein